MPVSMTLSPAWRDLRGRFAARPVAGAVDAQFPALARALVLKLQAATPVRSGQMKANWTAVYVPTARQVRIADRMSYWGYVTFGTGRQPANPALQAVLGDVSGDLQVTGDQVGQQILAALKG